MPAGIAFPEGKDEESLHPQVSVNLEGGKSRSLKSAPASALNCPLTGTRGELWREQALLLLKDSSQ